MNLCYLALGSNLKTPERQIRLALKALRALPYTYVLAVAKFHRNKAWGRKAQPDFINTVVKIKTRLTPFMLLQKCHEIEKAQGRVRHEKWGSRTIDIDILIYGSLKMRTKQLIIPHPRMFSRDFVMIPLSELAPDLYKRAKPSSGQSKAE
ncbi:2-amino-4-hydroxy-6-hydroxymethyldihydropteridine diphosphokinase [Legionella jordanis]|uniref:2-amino-4-hydroxy-6-hydroxymethyldihydropteridine pyrophosphokinase n=1 Tax=Legionella jordanis TaxID=456 RepID=A0A0W0VAQ5_9GAMM|nr:2-amino-4-hydroxy-6-hydroxymethyldihydropteridine diphosphokinase [Legionella jordanis]KTD17184.1 2-amino-4-hydroxy-6- hydroxymethyldihydropteridine pyrophosphokinase [Legionella jordanis]RMX03305.1 2-amino-4-hydroxy-6-hydroxymethyldihydropteridine diphosphokinase [Legionella jordanis]RMX18283.1 2-amino-4-hydroxy-6-hydroxymethyldihydropteridine diphosphokinase [Legionella jordanis]VEH12618.1 2-amino-4-hydroxy-6-hydroxymethyldihydropteridinepyrophosphokinase [Legionella jordanis]HAT8713308.1